MILSKPLKNIFTVFLTEVSLGLSPSRPRRDLQYYRAKSLTITLLGTGQFSRRHSAAEIPLRDIKPYLTLSAVVKGRAGIPSSAAGLGDLTLPTDLKPLADSSCICPRARPAPGPHGPPPRERPPPSH
jgi:hypothetical protein